MADSASPLKTIIITVMYYIAVCIFSSMGIFSLLVQIIRKGRSYFHVRDRPNPPACLQNSELGEHRYIRLKDVKLHYVEKGDHNKPLMIFVHGFPEFWFSWRHQIREFSRDYWVVAIDQRGYGDSDKPRGKAHYKIEKMVGDLKELIPALGRTTCHLVAHDWGGVVAFSFAQHHPDMLESLTIMNAPHDGAWTKLLTSDIRQILKSWYIFFFQLPYLPELMLSGNDFSFFEKVFRAGEAGKKAFTDEDIDAFKYTFGKPGALTPPINYYRSMDIATRMLNALTHDSQPKIPVSTLIVWGVKDMALSKSLAQNSADFMEKCEIKYIEEASHWVQQDAPQEVNKHMREFLIGLAQRR